MQQCKSAGDTGTNKETGLVMEVDGTLELLHFVTATVGTVTTKIGPRHTYLKTDLLFHVVKPQI